MDDQKVRRYALDVVSQFSNGGVGSIVLVYGIISIMTTLIYLVANPVSGIVFGVIASFLGMIGFHLLWEYQDNKDAKNPIWIACRNVGINILAAFGTIMLLFGVHTVVFFIFGIPILSLLFAAVIAGFFVYALYKIYELRLLEKDD